MNLRATVTCALALLLGVGGGSAGMYFWFQAREEHGIAAHGDEPESDGHSDAEHGQKAGAGEHEGHGEHEEGVVKLSAGAMRTGGVELAEADGGVLARTITLPGEVTANADRVAHIVPRVAGIVQEVRKNLGDRVEPGEMMAVLDSRELAEAKAACLAAAARETLAQTTLSRAEALFERKITPEEELLKARQQAAEAGIEHRTAEAKLHALGVTEAQVAALHASEEKDIDFPRYEIKAPFAGMVIEKHITLGELVDTEHNIFTIADLSSVWVDVTLYTDDLPNMRVGKEVVLTADGISGQTRGTIAYVSPTVSEATRTGLARAVVPNPDLMWRPGLFCT
ncbi:MAG: efflux RND transporter periplasmic adaptor subunit, partial [Planctomycetota bacterium]